MKTTKRFTKRARIWVKFADDTEESFTVPVQLVSRIAPVVSRSYPPHVEVWVEHRATIVQCEKAAFGVHSGLSRGDQSRRFADELRVMFGGNSATSSNTCAYCGNAQPVPASAR